MLRFDSPALLLGTGALLSGRGEFRETLHQTGEVPIGLGSAATADKWKPETTIAVGCLVREAYRPTDRPTDGDACIQNPHAEFCCAVDSPN